MKIIYCIMDHEEAANVRALMDAGDTVLVPVPCSDWNRDLSPWPADGVFKGGGNFGGGADAFLAELTDCFIPKTESKLGVLPAADNDPGSFKGAAVDGSASKTVTRYIAGYSLAGLFAVYAATKTDLFDGFASMSGSLWFDGFIDYLRAQPVSPSIKKAYFSLGDKESITKNERMKNVGVRTGEAVDLLRAQGIDVTYEIHPGGHFRDVEKRIAQGLSQL